MGRAAWAVAVALGTGLLAVAPGRWQLARAGSCSPVDRAAAMATGLIVDASLLVAPCTLLAAACLLCRRRATGRLALVMVAWLLWASVVSVCESFDSRGVFPSWVDVHLMWESPAMMRGSLDMFLSARWLVPSVAMLPLGVALVALWPVPPNRPRRVVALYALGIGFLLWLVGGSCARLVGGPLAAGHSPVGLLALAEVPEAAACLFGPCEPAALLDGAPSENDRGAALLDGAPSENDRGAALLGWPPPNWHATAAAIVARKLPSAEAAETAGNAAANVETVALVRALSGLSEELFLHSDEPVDVWQLVLEGVRADDLHGLNPAAPAELTPWLTRLHAQAAARLPGVFAALSMWTAGLRTPHGLAALTCGLGTLPYGLTLARDLPRLPLRCLPDLLADAGYALGYAYGGSPAFDRMGPFLEMHALEPWLTAATLAPDAERTGWGATDRALLGALRESADGPHPSYRMVITLSHHHPFVLPGDLPLAARDRAERAFSMADPCAGEGALDRLTTLAYTDDALAEWFTALERSGRLDRSIVAISADHPLPSPPLWRHRPGAVAAHRTRASVPFLLWISPKLLHAATDGARVQQLSETVARELAGRQLSQNDVPTLLLALLEHAPRIRELPLAARWHSMGGQATSPWYRASCGSRGRVHGIDAGTALFCVDDSGLLAASEQPVPLVITRARARLVAPSLQPAGALLGALGRVHAPRESTSAISAK